MDGREACPLPDDPALAEVAASLNDTGYWATIVDRDWRNVYMTDALRLSYGGDASLGKPNRGHRSFVRSTPTFHVKPIL